MKTKFKVFILLLMCLLFTFTGPVSYAATSPSFDNQIRMEDELFNKLIFQRMSLFNEEDFDKEKLTIIDDALIELGCTFLSHEEVISGYSDIRAEIPGNTNVTWISRRISNYSYNGELYNIQKIVATANDQDSCLRFSGSKQISFSSDYAIGSNDLILCTTHYNNGIVVGNTSSISLLNVVNANTSQGATAYTQVITPQITYSWLMKETVVFAYVRKENETDDMQVLAHISTGVNGSVSSTIMGFKCFIAGSWSSSTNITGQTEFYATSYDFNSTYSAVFYYNIPYAPPVHDAIYDTVITGPKGRSVTSMVYCWPFFPSQIT